MAFPIEEGIEASCGAVSSVVEGFAAFKKIPSDILLGLGIGRAGNDGLVQLDPNEWIPLPLWLRAFQEIERAVGTGALFAIGLKIPDTAIFPPWVTDVHTAIKSIDTAYHLNHRKNGRVMVNTDSGKMTDGIGHYGYVPIPGESRILSRVANPYPCDFDKGILTAMARRFAPSAWVDHLEPEVCRKKGADGCTYLVSWKDA